MWVTARHRPFQLSKTAYIAYTKSIPGVIKIVQGIEHFITMPLLENNNVSSEQDTLWDGDIATYVTVH